MRISVLAFAVALACAAVSPFSTLVEAQTAAKRETFDAASIKRSESTSMYSMRGEPSGLTATNVTVLELIKFAYEVIERDVVGELPPWMKTARFDVIARTSNGPLAPRRLHAMTRALLEDRFRLDAAYTQAEGRVLALVREHSDGRTFPNLRPSEAKCERDAPLEVFDSTPRSPIDLKRCGVGAGTAGGGGGLIALVGTRVTMPEVAKAMSRWGGYDQPIVDRTGMSGEFDVMAAPQSDMVAPTSQARFLIALREMTGLTLRSEEGTYEVLRIRRIEQPSPN